MLLDELCYCHVESPVILLTMASMINEDTA